MPHFYIRFKKIKLNLEINAAVLNFIKTLVVFRLRYHDLTRQQKTDYNISFYEFIIHDDFPSPIYITFMYNLETTLLQSLNDLFVTVLHKGIMLTWFINNLTLKPGWR